MRRIALLVLGLCLLLVPPARGQTAYGEAFREAWGAMQLGREAAAIEGFEACLELASENGIVAYYLACAHARAGSVDEALAWLRAASRQGWDDRGVAEWDPDLAALRGTDDFARWLEGLTDAPPAGEAEVLTRLPVIPSCTPNAWSLVTSWGSESSVRVQWDLRTGRVVSLDAECGSDMPQALNLPWGEGRIGRLTGGGEVRFTEQARVLTVVPETDGAEWSVRSDRGFHWTLLELPGLDALAVCTKDDASVGAYEMRTGRELFRLAPPYLRSHATGGPDGQVVASSCRDGTIRLWSVKDGTDVVVLEGACPQSGSLQFDPTGRRFASSGWDGRVRVWDLASGELVHLLEAHPHQASARFAPDGDRLFTSGYDWFSTGYDTLPTLWDARTGERIASLEGETGKINGAGWSPDGRYVAAGGSRGRTYLWNGVTGELVRVLEHGVFVSSLAWSPDSRWLAIGLGANRAHVLDVRDGSLEHDLVVPTFGGGDSVCSVEFDPTGRYLLAAAGLEVYLLDLVEGQRLPVAVFDGGSMSSLSATFRPDGKFVATSGRGRWTNRVFDLSRHGPGVDLGNRVSRASWSADGRWLLSGPRLLDAEQYRVRLDRREFAGGASLRYTPTGHHEGEASATAWSWVQVEGRFYPLDGYAPLLLDPKRVWASLARVDLGAVVLHPAPDVDVLEPKGRFERVADAPVRLVARAESALGILRFEVRRDGERVDSADVAEGTTRAEDGSARLVLELALPPGRDVTDLEIRAVDRKGVSGWPVLRTLHRSATAPVLP